jgi:hypothetical protein
MKSECSMNESHRHHGHCWCKLSVAFGLAHALGLLILGLLGAYYGYGLMMISTIASIYPGYAPTVAGSFIGAFWGFCDFFIFLMIVGFIYCALGKLCNKCCASRCKTDDQAKTGCCDSDISSNK